MWKNTLSLLFRIHQKFKIFFLCHHKLNKNKRNDKCFNNHGYSLFFWIGIFLKHQRLIPDMMKFQDCKIFTKLVPLQTPSRSNHRRSPLKNVSLKICKISQETLLKRAWHFTWKRLQHRCFPVEFLTFLRTLILKNICEWLLLPFLWFTKLNHNVFFWLLWRYCFLYNNINCYKHIPPLLTSEKGRDKNYF